MLSFPLSVLSSFVWGASIFLVISTSSVFGAWVGLELNLLSFVFLLFQSSSTSGGVSMKYFVPQSLGSAILVVGVLLGLSDNGVLASSLVISSLLLKLAMFPFHFWFLSLAKFVGWGNFFLLSSVQKVLPLYLIFMLAPSGGLSVAGAVGGLGSAALVVAISRVKPFLVYSSVLTTSWIFISGSLQAGLVYLVSYSASLAVVVLSALGSSTWDSQSSDGVSGSSWGGSVLFFLGMVSMAGVPPFLGFFAKLVALTSALTTTGSLAPTIVLLASGVFLYSYLRFSLKEIAGWGSVAVWGETHLLLICTGIVGLVLPVLIWVLCVGVTTMMFDLMVIGEILYT